MKRIFTIIACAFALPGAVFAAIQSYDTADFERVSVAAGIKADISVGSARSIRAETKADNFEDLEISVKNNVLHIGRPTSSWFTNVFTHRPDYQVHVSTPALHSLTASSGAEVTVKGVVGDFAVNASSGSDVDISLDKGGNVIASTSSGSEIDLSGSCVSLKADSSSGSDLDADDLKCETVSLQASSGSDLSVSASKSVTGQASSGSDIRVRGKPSSVEVDTSSGAHLVVKE